MLVLGFYNKIEVTDYKCLYNQQVIYQTGYKAVTTSKNKI